MEPTWATVLWVGAMALLFGIAIGRIQTGLKWVKADNLRRSQIKLTLSGSHRYSREEAVEVLGQVSKGIGGGAGGYRN